jgi:hypothetical protein
MKQNSSERSSKKTAKRRVLVLVGLLFSVMWSVTALVLLLMHAIWSEYVGSAILFVGFFVAWVVTVYVLHKKNPKYVEALLDDPRPDQQHEEAQH